ncbi:4-(cytidine 5'-diphospho)-2-C-methyl-D-erythritol kinase [Neorhizobium galegae]|uniref:4-(cytidine 5'-diphospho)-2-C-methyl-D-erythritol kinase n=1 Tax=Neorhizobium galegae TaxID=399 RepID=UPI0006222873|nr:4-(cytidine 5'-diphospho)-2-C-methyl-D-erythritol kinase [Neorhizobium galegae]KAB1126850.1 4-(cytidine 5'-diphospho)-2-C-methyl-D-erythritol kinase [Neorhizobium galegae]MCQ1808529.1 4-(cytidine 5'-diphospho)-2-C-methyl-D-erythritol kinase [Neorhizobium galegae]CDZ57257.1 4-(cytidine 5'-diphospho)-2-C-methyl-D-erythritol kinase [Neorhizobium galegae bv. orientalis]
MFLDNPSSDNWLADKAGLFELAPAKINLALHVTGQRADGYHRLESIVTFADTGDRLYFREADADDLSVSGRFASLLPTSAEGKRGNLVLKARDLLRTALEDKGVSTPPVAIHLEKNLPVAAGIGGGSADAAAALRGLMRFWNASLPDGELAALGLSLGADVPMCIKSEALMARGIGEELTALPDLPSLSLVLGNPLVGVSTPDIFLRLTQKENAAIGPFDSDWIGFLKTLRNDLEPPARSLVREIDQISSLIGAEGTMLTRMSGSGATCFGIFPSFEAAEKAMENLNGQKPEWYFQAVRTVGQVPEKPQ